MSDELKFFSQQAARGLVTRRDFLGRAAALGVAAPFATTMLSRAVQAAGPKKGGDLVLGLQGGSATDSLDPAAFLSDMPTVFGKCWGETLTVTTPDGGVAGQLAESFEATDSSAKVWMFKLRKGISFHNGKEMDANDVVQTLKRHSSDDSKSGALGIMKGIADISADGSHGVVITMKEGNADLPYLMSDYHLIIQPNGGNDGPDAGIGTGPYTVEVAEHGVRYVGKKFDGHWDDSVGHVARVEILQVNDPTARMSALQSGRIHMMNRADPKTVHLLERLPHIKVESTAGRGHYVFIMHCNTAPFDNNDLRLALKYSIDREEMVKRVLNGYGSVGNDFPINQAYPLFPDDIPQRTYDLDKAKHHFKKSGHSGKILLRTSEVAFPGAVDASVLFQQQASKAGIELEIKREPGDGYWSNVWNKQPFCASYWGGRPTQDQMYSTAYKSDADWNDTRFFRDDFDKLLSAARTELDEAKRKDMYREMSLMVRDEGGAIIPMFNDFVDAMNDKVQGYVKDPSGPTPLSNGFAPIRVWLA